MESHPHLRRPVELTPPRRRSPEPPHPRLKCLIEPQGADQGLSHALLQHLNGAFADVAFTLQADGPVDAVWICGYEPGSHQSVAKARGLHPEACLLVTGRDPVEDWENEVLAEGADRVSAWPLAQDSLAALIQIPDLRGAIAVG